MARKIGVLEPFGSVPNTYIKKCLALLQIRRNLAEWEVPGFSIRMKPNARAVAVPLEFPVYIPKSLDAVIGDGTKFVLPQNPGWQELHGPATNSLRTRAYMTLKAWKACGAN